MKYEDVEYHLLEKFPEFIPDEISCGLPYCIAGGFALYLLEAYKNNDDNLLISAGNFIEDLYSYEDEELNNLATVGYLEAIQNVWGNNSVNPEEMFKYLGERAKKEWVQLNADWGGPNFDF
ncbi:MAG: hypothetical protein FWG90_00850 [Oscillospiraceae bacterium]|nr:hypothetical protein [Oscillospiraceae bacterium]